MVDLGQLKLSNYEKVSRNRVPVDIKQAPEPKKPDNLVINKLNLFK